MDAKVTLIGNAGFMIQAGPTKIFIDAFYQGIPSHSIALLLSEGRIECADIILVTQDHRDHFSSDVVADVHKRTGATVVGPAAVIRKLLGKVHLDFLAKLEPGSVRKGYAREQTLEMQTAFITAFRTFHGRGHNSYLVVAPGFRFFHDGHNEDTRRIYPGLELVGKLDALFIAPWQGSGWVEFVERVAPARWFLMHLSEEELDRHEAGTYLPDLCDHVPLPESLVVLRPAQSFTFG